MTIDALRDRPTMLGTRRPRPPRKHAVPTLNATFTSEQEQTHPVRQKEAGKVGAWRPLTLTDNVRVSTHTMHTHTYARACSQRRTKQKKLRNEKKKTGSHLCVAEYDILGWQGLQDNRHDVLVGLVVNVQHEGLLGVLLGQLQLGLLR